MGERALLLAVFALAGVLFVVLGFMPAPYGRHARDGYGPGIPVRLAWMLMALPGLVVCPWLYAHGSATGLVPAIMLGAWVVAFAWRGLVYPILLRGTRGKRVPLTVVLLGVVLTTALSYLNGQTLAGLGRDYPLRWLWSLRFLYGFAMFGAGMFISRASDVALTRLRKPGSGDYVVPRGGFFGEVSCPNHLGEMFMWLGWAILTWSQAGLAITAIAVSTLLPRAVSHHLWYRRKFRDYPPSRRAILPFLL